MLKEIVKRYIDATTIIVKRDQGGKFTFVASGFLCSPKGYFITSAHAIDLASSLFIGLPASTDEFQRETGRTFNFLPLAVAQFDPVNDVALLKCVDSLSVVSPAPSVNLGDERGLPLGSSVGYIGFPFASLGLQTGKVSVSIVSAKALSANGTRILQVDSSVNDGNSGGPLIDVSSGKVVGVVAGRYSPSGNTPVAFIGTSNGMLPLGQESNVSYAVGISYAVELMKVEGIYE